MKKDKKNLVIKDEVKVLKPEQVIEQMKAQIILVQVPCLDGAVRCRLPDHAKLFKMKELTQNKDKFTEALFRSCLMDFTEEQLDELEKSDGFKYAELFKAVMSNSDLFIQTLSEQNIKN